jgi:CheY-like chemotaxis protein
MSAPLALVIEDDYSLSIIFSEAVRKAGFDTESYRDGWQAMVRLEKVCPVLVVLDLHLPGITGPDLLHCIRSQAGLEQTVVILATADPLLADLYRDQADFVLIKPISYGQLRDLAARLAQTSGYAKDGNK